MLRRNGETEEYDWIHRYLSSICVLHEIKDASDRYKVKWWTELEGWIHHRWVKPEELQENNELLIPRADSYSRWAPLQRHDRANVTPYLHYVATYWQCGPLTSCRVSCASRRSVLTWAEAHSVANLLWHHQRSGLFVELLAGTSCTLKALNVSR